MTTEEIKRIVDDEQAEQLTVQLCRHWEVASKGNIRYLDALPKEFTKEDLVGLRLANNESPVVKTIICRWVKESKIEKIGTNLWKKIQS